MGRLWDTRTARRSPTGYALHAPDRDCHNSATLTGGTAMQIIVAERFSSWAAWFADRPHESYGGDSPGTAVDRLWGAYLANVEAIASREPLE